MEVWKDISGYEGIYQVSDMGNVRSLDRWIVYKGGRKGLYKGKILTPGLCGPKRGKYLHVVLNKEGKRKSMYIHVLVGKAFKPNPENKPELNHINGNKTDNRAVNLEWTTRKENMEAYQTPHGKHPCRGLSIYEKKKCFQVRLGTNRKAFYFAKKRTYEDAERLAIKQRHEWEVEFGYKNQAREFLENAKKPLPP